MKILLDDTCLWGKAKTLLAESGHDTIWAGDWGQDPGDEEILQRVFSEGRVLVTLDEDFGELVDSTQSQSDHLSGSRCGSYIEHPSGSRSKSFLLMHSLAL